MKYIELKDKGEAELLGLLKEKKKLIFTLRQKLKTMQLSNPKELGLVRKDVARISTALSALKNAAKNEAKNKTEPAKKPAENTEKAGEEIVEKAGEESGI